MLGNLASLVVNPIYIHLTEHFLSKIPNKTLEKPVEKPTKPLENQPQTLLLRFARSRETPPRSPYCHLRGVACSRGDCGQHSNPIEEPGAMKLVGITTQLKPFLLLQNLLMSRTTKSRRSCEVGCLKRRKSGKGSDIRLGKDNTKTP